MSAIEWKCPRCEARHEKHGEGECREGRRCGGFYCDCDEDDQGDEHGESHADPCHNATCGHCGWLGTFPIPTFDPKKLKGWARKAYDAGWRPPEGWTP